MSPFSFFPFFLSHEDNHWLCLVRDKSPSRSEIRVARVNRCRVQRTAYSLELEAWAMALVGQARARWDLDMSSGHARLCRTLYRKMKLYESIHWRYFRYWNWDKWHWERLEGEYGPMAWSRSREPLTWHAMTPSSYLSIFKGRTNPCPAVSALIYRPRSKDALQYIQYVNVKRHKTRNYH